MQFEFRWLIKRNKFAEMLYSAIKQSTRVAHDTWEGWFYIFKINKSQNKF